MVLLVPKHRENFLLLLYFMFFFVSCMYRPVLNTYFYLFHFIFKRKPAPQSFEIVNGGATAAPKPLADGLNAIQAVKFIHFQNTK
jgi:hypothetical protein